MMMKISSLVVNRDCEKFKLNELSLDIFDYVMFVKGLIASKDANIRSRILTKLEQDQNLTGQEVADECYRL